MVEQNACFLQASCSTIVLPPRHSPKEEYTPIYICNELNLGQNSNGENSLVFKVMFHALHCQWHKHIMQSVVGSSHGIMAAATAADDEVSKIALPPVFQWALLNLFCTWLGQSLHSWGTHWISTVGLSWISTALGMENFLLCFYRRWWARGCVCEGRMGLLLVPRASLER